jgi:cytochrome c5
MTGSEVYKKHCVVCHASGVAGAPIAHDEAIWAARKNKDIDSLLKTALKGEKAMPPKGTCMTCSDDELKSAIEFMRKKL